MSQPTLNDLAARVSELSQDFTKFLETNNIPQPTLAADSPTSYSGLTPDAFLLRQKLIDAINDMWIVTQGPSESIFNYVHNVCYPIPSPLPLPPVTQNYADVIMPSFPRSCQTRLVSTSSTTLTSGPPFPSPAQPPTPPSPTTPTSPRRSSAASSSTPPP